jgi:hypothetical protein
VFTLTSRAPGLAIACLAIACAAPARDPAPPVDPSPPPRVEDAAAPAWTEPTLELAPMSIAIVGDTLVWTDMAGSIWTRPIAGGEPRQLSDQQRPDFAFSLLVAKERVIATGRRGLLAVTLPAGPVTELAVAGLPGQPEDSVADADHVYLTLFRRDEIVRVPARGGKAETIARIRRGVLALHGPTLYVASYTTGVLHAVPAAGGTPRVIARGLPRPTGVAVDATHAFVYCEGDRTLHRIDLATGERTALAQGLINSDKLVAHGEWIYTRTWGARHALVRIAKAGGEPEVLTTDVKAPYRIALDADAVYVTSRDDRRIVRVPR